MKKAFITGITGQDGSYLAELLLEKGYEVHGLVRRLSTPNLRNVESIKDRITIHIGDVTDSSSLNKIAREVNPDEVYNLAAQSYVHASWSSPVATVDITGVGTLRMLEAFKDTGAKFYQAGSSEQFGNYKGGSIITEESIMSPRSPYGCAKVLAYNLVRNYRESYGMFAVTGILFNHESERRGYEFVTRKISNAVAEIYHGISNELVLGNINSIRDWGYAPDYVEAMWQIMQLDEPNDIVIATGETHTVKEFCEKAFAHAGLDWKEHVVTSGEFIRPAELDWLRGDASKAKEMIDWKPSVEFDELVERMVDSDIKLVGESL
jgi:GDPmannose 4,6-dehydratase